MKTEQLLLQRFPAELKRKIKKAAIDEGVSMQEWIIRRCNEKLHDIHAKRQKKEAE
jgi:predicted HicB family RNase H-like nuclease